jgi:hypothetical protein
MNFHAATQRYAAIRGASLRSLRYQILTLSESGFHIASPSLIPKAS